VAGALFGRFLALGLFGIDTLGDIWTLGGNRVQNQHAIGMKNVIIVCITNVADGLASDGVKIEFRLGGDFSADNDEIALGVSLASDATVRVLLQARVQDRIGNGIANFVWMGLANGFRRKDVV